MPDAVKRIQPDEGRSFRRVHVAAGIIIAVMIGVFGLHALYTPSPATADDGVRVITGATATPAGTVIRALPPTNGLTPPLTGSSLIERQLLVRAGPTDGAAGDAVKRLMDLQLPPTTAGVVVDLVLCTRAICEVSGRLPPSAGTSQAQRITRLTSGVLQAAAKEAGLQDVTETSIDSDATGTLIFTLHGARSIVPRR